MRVSFAILIALVFLEPHRSHAFLGNQHRASITAMATRNIRMRRGPVLGTSVDATRESDEGLAPKEPQEAPETSAEEPQEATNNEDEEHHFSKRKWKAKRYIMLHYVDELIKKGDAHAPKKAQEVVERMNYLYESSNQQYEEYKPTVQAYNLWINALAKCSQQSNNSGRAAEQVLQEMKERSVQPNVVSYTSVIDAYARSGRPNAAQEAERVLFELLEQQQYDKDIICVSSVTCDAVLNAWAQQSSLEAAERAQFILERMEQLQNDEIRPTPHSYTTVINGFAKCGAAVRAEAILNRMLKQQNEKDAVRPDTPVFNAVIHAWATSGDPRAGTQAVALLNKMQELHSIKGFDTKPDEITYNSVLSSWSHSGHINAAQQAERILHQMQTAANTAKDAPAPNTVSYNSVLHAWSKSTMPGAAQRAQTLLEYMIAQDDNIAPDVISFTSVLNAWAKSKEPEKAVKARAGLDELLNLYKETGRLQHLRPTVIPFNAVLNACAFSAMGTSIEEQRQALQVAVSTFTELRDDPNSLGLKPDSITYGNMIKCCNFLVPQGEMRNKIAIRLFGQCCQDGMVAVLVWKEIQRTVPIKILSEVLQSKAANINADPRNVQVRDLPKKWRRNTFKGKKKKGSLKRKAEKEEEEPSAPPATAHRPNIREASWDSSRDL